MSWYAAHAIMYFKLKDRPQESYTIWENVFLIEASHAKEAWEKAVEWAKREEGDSDGSLTMDGQPATMVFAGIRKVITVSHWEKEGKLNHGDEITYSEFQVSDEASIQKLVKWEEVTLEYIE